MPNRAERRAQEKQSRRRGGVDQQRNRAGRTVREEGMSEAALQNRSMHLQTSGTDEWKPSSSTSPAAKAATVSPDDEAAKNRPSQRPRTVMQWGRFFSWLFIILAAIAFIVVMFIPNRPMWAIVTVSAVFVVGVLSLFLFGGSPSENPNVDSNGTAV